MLTKEEVTNEYGQMKVGLPLVVPASLSSGSPLPGDWRQPTEEDKRISRYSWKRVKTRGRYVVVVQRFLGWADEERWQLETRSDADYVGICT